MDVRDDERLAQDLDHRNRRAHRCLEAELDSALGGGREEVRAPAGDQLLVRRDDRLPGAKQVEDVAAGRLDPAHHLGDERDAIVLQDRPEIRRQDPVGRGEVALLLEVADERARHPQPVSRRALDLLAVLDEEAVDRCADGPVAEERDGDVDRWH